MGVALFFGGAAQAQPLEIEGVKLESLAQVGSASLPLNGAGVRVRAIFKVYVASLYAPQKTSALNDGLKNKHTDAQLTAIAPQTVALKATLKAVGEVKNSDVIYFDYLPGAGTRMTVNGRVQGAAIPGETFFTAVLRIWLGDNSADSGLKKGLMGAGS
jgi:hypothetical protein